MMQNRWKWYMLKPYKVLRVLHNRLDQIWMARWVLPLVRKVQLTNHMIALSFITDALSKLKRSLMGLWGTVAKFLYGCALWLYNELGVYSVLMSIPHLTGLLWSRKLLCGKTSLSRTSGKYRVKCTLRWVTVRVRKLAILEMISSYELEGWNGIHEVALRR